MVTHREVPAGVTVLVSLSSLVFQGSGGDFPRRKAGCPSHGRQSFQAEELGKAGVQQRWPFCFSAAPWPGPAWSLVLPLDPQPPSYHPLFFPVWTARLYNAASPEQGHAGSPRHTCAQGGLPSTVVSAAGNLQVGAISPFYRTRKQRLEEPRLPEGATGMKRRGQIHSQICLPPEPVFLVYPPPIPYQMDGWKQPSSFSSLHPPGPTLA